jgi:hypothetical protein
MMVASATDGGTTPEIVELTTMIMFLENAGKRTLSWLR